MKKSFLHGRICLLMCIQHSRKICNRFTWSKIPAEVQLPHPRRLQLTDISYQY
uniref:Uncharacterized protein n=1 Tax=Anguilla anguilla TaxID=7936 RepID=A0A0E9T5M0_ANGAN